MGEQISNGDGEVMIRVHQSHGPCDDAMAVRVGIVAERNVEVIFELDQTGHSIGA
jgi:hypothetical protein